MLSYVWLFATPWMVTCQAPLSKKFSRQEYWIGLLFPTPGDLRNQGPNSHLLLDSQILFYWATWETLECIPIYIYSKSFFSYLFLHTVPVTSPYINCISKLNNLREWPLTPYFVLSCIYWDCMKYSVERWARLQVL